MIHIRINGDMRELPAPQSVESVLQSLELPAERVAVELDRMIVRRRAWASTAVGDGAQLEIVEFVGGG